MYYHHFVYIYYLPFLCEQYKYGIDQMFYIKFNPFHSSLLNLNFLPYFILFIFTHELQHHPRRQTSRAQHFL